MHAIKLALREFVRDRCGTAAAALAYFASFAVPPILLLALVITAWLFGHDAAYRGIDRQLAAMFSPEVAAQLERLLQNAWQNSGRGWFGLIAGAAGI